MAVWTKIIQALRDLYLRTTDRNPARNPEMAPLPDNVIPLHVARLQRTPRTPQAPLDEIPIVFGQLRDVD